MTNDTKQNLSDEKFLILLGRRIKEIRQEKFGSGLESQAQFAEAIGISEKELRFAEEGQGIDTLLLHKISNCFSISFDDLFTQEWDERMTELRSNLDYAAKFTAAGESYSELDEAGEIKVHRPTDDVS